MVAPPPPNEARTGSRGSPDIRSCYLAHSFLSGNVLYEAIGAQPPSFRLGQCGSGRAWPQDRFQPCFPHRYPRERGIFSENNPDSKGLPLWQVELVGYAVISDVLLLFNAMLLLPYSLSSFFLSYIPPQAQERRTARTKYYSSPVRIAVTADPGASLPSVFLTAINLNGF